MTPLNIKKIPCSVGILTFNSEKTLRRALESVKDFDDIIICDGGSTDNTLEIAKEFKARILMQADEFKNSDGSLKNFSGVRNQTLDTAKYDWFLFLDSDEYLSESLVEEIASVVLKNDLAAYWVPRLYVWKERIIQCASTYPNKQMRFFNKHIAKKFIKEVHERIALKENAPVLTLEEPLYVPFPETVAELKNKWTRYIEIEVKRRPPMSFVSWIKIAFHESAVAVLFGLRTIRNLFFCSGTSMPLKFEMLRLWYQFALAIALISKISRKNK